MNQFKLPGVAAAALLLLAACSSAPAEPGLPDDASCTHTLEDDVTRSTVFGPTGADCDVLISGLVNVTSELVFRPGTRIAAAPEARITIGDQGRITATGTADERIQFIGTVATQGSWYGICFSGQHLESRFDFVDLFWAGGVWSGGSHVCRAAIGGVNSGGGPVHVTHSEIIGAYTSGIDATRFTLGEFRNNLMAGNREFGMRVSPDNMGRLDASSNFGAAESTFPDGRPAANGRQYVGLDSAHLTTLSTRDGYELWSPVDVPYFVTRGEAPYGRSDLWFAEGTMTVLAPGIELVMPADAGIVVDSGAALMLQGAPENPVRLTGEPAGSGVWDGIWMAGGGIIADHAVITGAGNDTGLLTRGAITFSYTDGPTHCSHLRNSSIVGSASNGILIGGSYEPYVRIDSVDYSDIALADLVGEANGPAILDGADCV